MADQVTRLHPQRPRGRGAGAHLGQNRQATGAVPDGCHFGCQARERRTCSWLPDLLGKVLPIRREMSET